MTEKLAVEGTRLTVERVEGKESVDLDLTTVIEAYFEASPAAGRPGALLLRTEEREYVVRVDNDDAATVMERVWPTVEAARREREAAAGVREGEEPKTAEPTETTSPRKRAQRS